MDGIQWAWTIAIVLILVFLSVMLVALIGVNRASNSLRERVVVGSPQMVAAFIDDGQLMRLKAYIDKDGIVKSVQSENSMWKAFEGYYEYQLLMAVRRWKSDGIYPDIKYYEKPTDNDMPDELEPED